MVSTHASDAANTIGAGRGTSSAKRITIGITHVSAPTCPVRTKAAQGTWVEITADEEVVAEVDRVFEPEGILEAGDEDGQEERVGHRAEERREPDAASRFAQQLGGRLEPCRTFPRQRGLQSRGTQPVHARDSV